MIDTKIYPDIFDRIKESLDSAVHYFELLIKIKHYTLQTLSHTTFEDKCSINNVDENIESWLDDYDLILFPSFDYDNPTPNVFASAYPCINVDGDYRPFAGRIYIENNFDFGRNNIHLFYMCRNCYYQELELNDNYHNVHDNISNAIL
jgi:hypothetical protein